MFVYSITHPQEDDEDYSSNHSNHGTKGKGRNKKNTIPVVHNTTSETTPLINGVDDVGVATVKPASDDITNDHNSSTDQLHPVTKATSPLPYSHSADDPYREHSTSSSDEEAGQGAESFEGLSLEIDWTEVEAGTAAGIPGKWETVSVTKATNNDLSSMIGDDLCKALQIKAAAYSDETWQSYWSSNGPYLLAQYWRERHPDVPLKKVDVISGLGFLCDDMEGMMTERQREEEEEEEGGVNTVKDESTAVVSDGCGSNGCGQDDATPESAVVNDDEHVLSLWNTFYNEIYWQAYLEFVRQSEDHTPIDHTLLVTKQQAEMESLESTCTEDESTMVSRKRLF